MKTNLENLTGQAPLWCKFDRQYLAQSAYVEISRNGDVCYDYNSEIGNGVPMGVWNARDHRIEIPNDLTASGYVQLHDHILERLTIVAEGMNEHWDGSNFVGSLTEDARLALDDLRWESYSCVWHEFDKNEEIGEVEP